GELTLVTFKEGDDVRKGQVLFELDRRPLVAALEQAEAVLARDVAQAANTRAQAPRYEDLANRGIATRDQVEQTRSAAAALVAQPTNDAAASSKGRIAFVDNQVDPTTGTIRLKGTFPNENRRLWPGQYVNVSVTLTTDPTALVVPTTAVQTGQQGQYVFIVKP